MQKITPFVIQKIEEKLSLSITDKGACAQLRQELYNSESENGFFSLNTIKRWFGLIEKQIEPRKNGLEAIASFLGYPSWDALTLEPDYSKLPDKTEDDYISDIYSEYSVLVRSIEDYTLLKDKAKTQKDLNKYKKKLEELWTKQNLIKDAIYKLSELLVDPSEYQYDWDKAETLFKTKYYDETNALLDEYKLKEEQARLLRSLKKKGSDISVIHEQLKKNSLAIFIKAQIFRSKGQLEEAEKFYHLALKSDRSFPYLFSLGGLYMDSLRYDDALPIFKEIHSRMNEIVEASDDETKSSLLGYVLDSIYNIGQIYLNIGKYEDGIRKMKLFIEALNQTDKTKNIYAYTRIADTYNEIGNIFYQQGKLDDAKEFYYESMKIYHAYSLQDYIETSLNLAYIDVDTDRYQIAREAINKALKYYQMAYKRDEITQNHYRLSVGKIYFLYGYMYTKQNSFELAIQSYNRALIYFETLYGISPNAEIRLEIFKTLLNLSKVYFTIEESGKEKECLIKAQRYS